MCLQAADELRAAVCLITSGCPPASAAAAHVCLPDFLQGQSLTSELPGSCDILSDDLRRCSQRSWTRRRVSRSHMLLEKLGLFTPGNLSLVRHLIPTCICLAFFRGQLCIFPIIHIPPVTIVLFIFDCYWYYCRTTLPPFCQSNVNYGGKLKSLLSTWGSVIPSIVILTIVQQVETRGHQRMSSLNSYLQ